MNLQEAYRKLDLARGVDEQRVKDQYEILCKELQDKILVSKNIKLQDLYKNRLQEIESAFSFIELSFKNNINIQNKNNGNTTSIKESVSGFSINSESNKKVNVSSEVEETSVANKIRDNNKSSKNLFLIVSVVGGLIVLILVCVIIYLYSSKKEPGSSVSNSNSFNDSVAKTIVTTYNNSLPSEYDQKEKIKEMYRSFDNAFTYESMNSYLNTFYDLNTREKLSKHELYSYEKYYRKYHQIIEIRKTNENSNFREFEVIFNFDFERSDGSSGIRKCMDIISMDNNYLITGRRELGEIR